MPELPEVETMRRGILGVVGSEIVGLEKAPCTCRPILLEPAITLLRRRCVGQRITAVERLGKRVVAKLNSGDSLVFEPRMTGLILVADPPDEHHLRLRIDLDGAIPHVWYWDRRGLGSVRLLAPAELAAKLGATALGPDALSLDPVELRQRLGRSRREIKVVLLDQKSLAGIGNLYAAEILHHAAIHPRKRCHQLRPADWNRLHAAVGDVLRDAIRHEGSTLSDGTYRNALNQAGNYQQHHRVYGRAGELCPTCRACRIERFVQAQRATFYCPHCQGTVRRVRRFASKAPRTARKVDPNA